MNWKNILAAAVLAGSSAVAAVPTPPATATTPATRPSRQVPEDRRPRVLVLPFTELSDEPKREWVGKAMQQSLIAELTRSGMVAVVTPPADAPPANDAAAAATLARGQHAPLAILGSYQLIGEELRVTGQMIESINGEHIAAIKATGSLRDLFGIEDMMGGQVRRDLQAILQPEQVASSNRGANDPFGVQPSGPVQRQTPTGAYDGSDLQRSLGTDQWAPNTPTYTDDRRNRYRYDYPTVYYPPYSYYDWCGYNYYRPWRPIYGPAIPSGPGETRTNFPQNNYVTTPGQMGRRTTNNNYVTTPGQMNRPGGNTNFANPPGQMGRSSSGNQVGPAGQSGRAGSSSGSSSFSFGSPSRSSGSSSSGAGNSSGSRGSVPGSSGNASGNLGSSSGNASRR
jgi:TolB-like protein